MSYDLTAVDPDPVTRFSFCSFGVSSAAQRAAPWVNVPKTGMALECPRMAQDAQVVSGRGWVG